MKKVLILAFSASLFFSACQNKQKNGGMTVEELSDSLKAITPTAEKFPVMEFDKSVVDLGKINEGDSLFHTYRFVNKGNMPLVISSVNASCGCTTPKWTQEPVLPGGSGEISVKFNSKNKEGKLRKTVSIYANTNPQQNEVAFNVEVIKKEK